MSSLTPDSYAVIEGRHSDPFRYLGPHVENDSSVVRVFLPDAEGVAIVDEQGKPRRKPCAFGRMSWKPTCLQRRLRIGASPSVDAFVAVDK
jgi:hypothetical protein